MRLVIHYTIVFCISALLPGLVADPRSQQQSKVTLCKYKESCNALSISYWPQVWSLPVVTDSFCKDLIDMTLADKDAKTFFMVMFTVMLLLMLMTLTMLLKTFLICYSFGRMFILGPIVCDFFIRSVHYEWLDQCFVKQSKSRRTGTELFARSHEHLYSSYAAVSRHWGMGGDWILVWNQYFIITKTQHSLRV